MNRRLRRLLIALAAAAGGLYVTLVAYIALNETKIVYPGVEETDEREWLPPSRPGFTWDSLRVTASDGVPAFLLTSRIADTLAHPWVLYFHGNGSLMGADDNVDRYRLLNDAGFNVLAMEFRGMGVSRAAGPPSSTRLHLDALAAWSYLVKDLRVPANRIVVYGWSLGGGVALRLAAAVPAAGVVTEGAFSSLANVGAERYPWLPVGLVARNSFENALNGSRLSVPWIVFHGRTDRVVGFAHAESLAVANKSARLVPLKGGHMSGVIGDRAVALEALRGLAGALTEGSR